MHEVKPYHKAHPHSRLLVFESLLFLAFVVFLFLLLGYSTNAAAAAVLLAFLPSLLFGIIIIVSVQTDHFHPSYNWFILVSLLVVFALIYFLVPSTLVQGIDALTVLVMNAIMMSLALLVFHSSYSHEPRIHEHELEEYKAYHEAKKHERKEDKKEDVKPEEHKEEPKVHVVERVVHVHHEAEEEISGVVHSIEDKAKALNFVIGRVYSVYHGGTEKLRNKIRIDKTWYQEFNQIDQKDSERRRAQAIVLLGKIKDRLELLQKSEKDVFGEDVNRLRNIQHNAEGRDPIIEVLVRNDKDPVRRYYDGAHKFCEEAIQKLSEGKSLQNVMNPDPKAKK